MLYLDQWATRLAYVALGWGVVGLIYLSTSLIPHSADSILVLHETLIERRFIPFIPSMIVWYESFFVFVLLGFFGAPLQRIAQMANAMQLSAVFCGVVFILFPTTLIYPAVDGATWAGYLWLLTSQIDTAYNCVPSLHAALTCLVLIAMWDVRHQLRCFFMVLWAVLILYSIVAVRRHLGVDVLAGSAVAMLMWWLARKLNTPLLGAVWLKRISDWQTQRANQS